MKKLLIAMLAFLIFGCKGEILPLLPDIDQTVNDVDTSIFNDLNSGNDEDPEDESENDDDVIMDEDVIDNVNDLDMIVDEDVENDDTDTVSEMISSLLVATIKGYDVPQSGKVYEFDESTLEIMSESSDDMLFGSETGSDTNLAVFDDTFSVLARNYGKSVYFSKDISENIMSFDIYTETSEDYINFQDMVYNTVKDEYVISSHRLDELIILKDGVFKRQKITDDDDIFPVKMIAVGERIYVNLQYLDDLSLIHI